jgi:hypothetical protein
LWVSSYALLVFALIFAGMSYYVGLLILGSPIQTARGLRKFGWRLVYDGSTSIVAIFVVLSFVLILNLVMNVVFPASCWFFFVCYNPFALANAFAGAEAWVNSQIWDAMGVGAFISAIPIALNAVDKIQISGFKVLVGFGGLLANWAKSVLTPYAMAVNAYVLLLNFLLLWVTFIGPPGNFWAVFMILGCFFYAMPGRVGRVAAGWLIGTPLSYLVAFPFLPYFVDAFAGNIHDSFVSYLSSKVIGDLFKWPPSFDFATVTSVTLTLLNPVTVIVVRLVLTGLYIALMAALNVEIARLIAAGSLKAPGELG